MKVIFQSQLSDSSGFGRAARQYYKILKDLCLTKGWELKVLNVTADNIALPEHKVWEDHEVLKTKEEINFIVENEQYFFVFHANLNFASRIKSTYVLSSRSKRNFCITVWESNQIPSHWEEFLESIGCYDVITPSTWNREVFKKYIPDFNIHYIPHYDDNEIKYDNGEYKLLSISQDVPRKNWKKTIRAFYNAFWDKEVEFVIKTNGNLQANNDYQKKQKETFINMIKREKSLFKNTKCKIRLIYSVIKESDLEKLYQESTHYFSMTHGEGFGLGMMEAKSRGLSIIAPNKGGHIDFCDSEDILFDAREEYISDNLGIFPQGSTWFESSVLDATDALLKSLDSKSSNPVSQLFKFESVLKKFEEIINE